MGCLTDDHNYVMNYLPEQVTGPGLILIEGGTFTMGGN